MAQVDPDDDSIRRFIVQHYRYDPERHERRHVVVAAFDNDREFRSCIDATAAEVRRRKEHDGADAREHVTGAVHEAGYQRLQQNARLLERALAHGVSPAQLPELDLPANVAALTPVRPARKWLRWRLRRPRD